MFFNIKFILVRIVLVLFYALVEFVLRNGTFADFLLGHSVSLGLDKAQRPCCLYADGLNNRNNNSNNSNNSSNNNNT